MSPSKFSLLTQVLEETLAGRRDEARRSLAALTAPLNTEAVTEDIQYALFAAALARRLGNDDAQALNLYLRRYELSQISLFNLIAEQVPLASLANALANALLVGHLAGREEVTLLDVGLGTGRQVVALLRALRQAGAVPRRLSLVGVDPDASSLRQAEVNLQAEARSLGLAPRFHGIPKAVEALDEADWRSIQRSPGRLVVHSGFSLHHVVAEADREALFQRLRALEPIGLVLCEPHVDHHMADVRQRFHNAWRHFTFTFALVDSLELSPRERNAIKLFFGRELEDILGTVDEAKRYERHERVEAWLERLRRAGFSLAERLEPAGGLPLPGGLQPGVSLQPGRGYIGLGYREEILLAVISATSGQRGE